MKIIKIYFLQIFIFRLILIHIVKAHICKDCKKEVSRKLGDNEEKAQFFFNLIKLHEAETDNYICHGIVKYFNGDIVIEFIENEGGSRTFFGLKANGKYLFGDEEIMSDNSFIHIDYSEITTNNIIPFIIKDENNNEYMVSIIGTSSTTFYFDINDFELKTLYQQQLKNIFTLENNGDLIIPIEIKENNNYYIIICGMFKNLSERESLFKLYKISIQQEENPEIIIQSSLEEDIVVDDFPHKYCCYNIEAEKIINFNYKETGLIRYIFNYHLEKEKEKEISIPDITTYLMQCIHIKNNKGSLIYVTNESESYYLNIQFLNYINLDEFTNYLPTMKYHVDYNSFYDGITNFIKINENKICFLNLDYDYIIYVYLIYLYEQEEKVVLREYSIQGNDYNFNINSKISPAIYNNFIALEFDYNLPDDYNIKYDGLMILGYANGIDYDLLLENHIINENNLNIEIDLKSFLKIENNLFGYEYIYTKIIDLFDCNNIDFYSSKNINKEIIKDSILEKDENIKFDFETKDYNPFKCIIEYRNIVSEPDLSIFNKYPNNIQNSESEEYFNAQKGEYIGKQTSYKIIVNNELTTICESDCTLCQKTGEKKCLTNIIVDNKNKEEKKLINYMNSINATEINSVVKNLDLIVKNSNPNYSYLIARKTFTLSLNKLNEYNKKSNVNIDFTECEKKLRETLPPDIILRIAQINIPPTKDKILNEQAEYRIYDQNNKEIDLSICSNISIIVENKIINSSKLNMYKILELKNSGVDLFNINDEFFHDICIPYSDNETNSDMILSDKINDLFQNFSVCGDGCKYQSFNETELSINCICNIKQEISLKPEEGNFVESIKIAFLYSNFGVIKCYKLFFSPKGKLENIGFFIFTIIILGNIPGYIFYLIRKITPIQNYLNKEMENTGYITKTEEGEDNKIEISKNKFETNQNITSNEKEENNQIIKIQNNHKLNPPKKMNKLDLEENNKYIDSRNKIKIRTNNHNSNNYINKYTDIKVTENLDLNLKDNINIKNNEKDNLKLNIEKNEKDKKQQSNEEHLILLNSQNCIEYTPQSSKYNLNNYTYEEAIKYEKRSYLRIFYIFLISTEKILNTFVYKQPLELKPLRICLLLFNLSTDIFLNTFFYLSENISDKYHFRGLNQFIFSLTNNIANSVSSAIVGFILVYFLQNLIQSTDKIKKIFKEEEELMKKDKEYKVDENKKKEINYKIKDILKCLKIKIIIFIETELILMLFFLYYITVFCHVYKETQISLLYDILISYGFSLLISLGVALIFSITYVVALKKKIKVLYKITIFIYNLI